MEITEINKRMNELDEVMEEYENKIAELHEKISVCWAEKDKLNKLYNAKRLKDLNITKDNVVVGFSKTKDYHFQMIKAFVILKVETAHHISTVSHTYRCDDFDYSYRIDQKNVDIESFVKMLDEFDMYVLSIDDYNDLLVKMAMLKIDIDNLSEIASMYAQKAIKKLNE